MSQLICTVVDLLLIVGDLIKHTRRKPELTEVVLIYRNHKSFFSEGAKSTNGVLECQGLQLDHYF